jgi:CHAT domain-containing protein
LSNPQPHAIEQTQGLLADDQALVVFDFDAKSYAWVITKTDANWTDLTVAAKDLDAEVKTLRQSLTSDNEEPFDAMLSYKIYQSTFGAIADKIASKKRLSLITNGALTSLPPQLLITSDPTGKALKDQAWLVRSYAITILAKANAEADPRLWAPFVVVREPTKQR